MRRLRYAPTLFAATALLASAGVFAQEVEAIETDRPDFVESAETVGKGRVQIETGFMSERNNGDRATSTPTLIRVGVSDNVELRLETDGRVTQRFENSATARVNGYADVALGVKWHFLDENGLIPSSAVLVHAEMETGSSALRGKGTRPSVRFVQAWELTKEISLGVMEGVVFDRTETDERFTSPLFGITLATAWSEQFTSFIELAAQQIVRNKYGGTQATFDVGMSYKLTKDVQLDVSINKGLTTKTPDLAAGVGVSIRF